MKNLSILVVDDDPVIRRLLQQRLRKEKYEVVVAEDGYRAEAILGERSFDVVLTDLMMPGGIGGIEVLDIAKGLHQRIEVVLITAHSSIDTAVEAMKKGAADYLEKPINFDELFLRLDKIANLKTIIRSAQDLEHAMSVTESTASETIQNLEIEISKKQQSLEAIEDILVDQALPEDEKINQALNIISNA